MVDRRDLPPGIGLAWGDSPLSRRGPKPAYSVEQIVTTAMAVIDTYGYAALSMPKVAKRLRITPAGLYRYVASKDELLVLLSDAGWGEPPADLYRPGDWRATVTAVTHAIIDRLCARPWLLDIPIPGAPVTPNLLRWTEVQVTAFLGAGLDGTEALRCVVLLDGYARSIARLARDIDHSKAAPVQSAAMTAFLEPLLKERGYPVLAAMLTEGQYRDPERMASAILDDDLDFGLERILDGIEKLVQTRASG
ncbi:TetR family transcriptional regulator [Herbihabitans rhizosphaerae]|uniref:TetR family transcriptional regulator n=1 Tax=Herbihabitans rhizosphaerae TaxID=1872711 RepID=A0A4Q7KR69_9PSEU|nr:TetR/AcrR family transcriptional regulator [Herbihabitans rhizosphaerae]RZS38947.1 TetR family transcriptional regulator [Herbihabitans rhizosphaerae]